MTCMYVVSFFCASRRRHTRCAVVTGVQTCALPISGIAGPFLHQRLPRRRQPWHIRATDDRLRDSLIMATLDPHLVLGAYATGVFPMAASRDAGSVFWVEPRQRAILPLDRFRVTQIGNAHV